MGTPYVLSQVQNLVKKNYTTKVTQSVATRDYVTLNKIKWVPSAGNPHHLPLVTSDGAGVATDIASAEASATNQPNTAFSVEMSDLYGSVQVLTKTRLAFKKNFDLLADWVKKETDAKMNTMGKTMTNFLFGPGGGHMGRVSALATNTFTVATPNDINNIWEGMQLVFSTGDGTSGAHTLRAGSPGYLTVQSVDRNAGTFITDAVAGVTGVAVNDYIFIRGGFAGNVSQTNIFKGFGVWFPTAAPTDTLWGLARTGKAELAGFLPPSADQVGGPLQRIAKACTHGNVRWGATPRDIVMHNNQRLQLNIGMQNQGLREISVGETTGTAGYKKLVYASDYGDVDIWADPFCNPQIAYLLDFSTFEIRHLGDKMIDFDMPDDNKGSIWTQLATAAGHSARLFCFSNLCVESPWKNGAVPLAAV